MRNAFFGLTAPVLAAAAALGCLSFPQAASARDTVAFSASIEPGTIVISASQRKLFYIVRPGVAIRYSVAVPKRGKEWSGYASVDGKYLRPDWTPPPVVKADHPELPDLIPGGSPRNPMGLAALTLDRGEVAIHGTTARMRASIGTAASYGCIRMLNEDVADLYSRVEVGSPVLMQP
ncbi:MAG: L,D-transpeptidase [Methylocystis sp.]|uniref:L,D-transpeptidase n=1 Tax=Methylocystis sp. TaxID=1911079 RepID=UPI003DA6A261